MKREQKDMQLCLGCFELKNNNSQFWPDGHLKAIPF